MKILRIIYNWPPPWMGLAPHPYELTVSQVHLGHTFQIFCGRWPKAGALEQPQKVQVKGFMREPLTGLIYLTTAPLMFLYYLYWTDHNKVDLIHSHGEFGIWVYLYRFLAKRFFPKSEDAKVPFVSHFHNTVAGREDMLIKKEKPIRAISRYFTYPLGKFSDKLAINVSDACIFVSDDTRKEAINFYKADPNKCFVVESGVNTKRFHRSTEDERYKTRTELGFKHDDKVILNLGVMSARKNPNLLIKALELLPANYKLLLVGDGDREYMDELQLLINELQLNNRVVRVGYTPYPDTHIAYQSADIFVLPSEYEGLPKVVVESLACGLPTVVSGFKASEDITGLYYLDSITPEVIALKIKNIMDSPVEVDTHKVFSAYSWEYKAHQVEKVYDYVFEKTGRQKPF